MIHMDKGRQREDGWMPVCFCLCSEILSIWFTITLSGPGPELWSHDGFSVCFLVYGFEILIFCCGLIRLSGLAG